MEVDFVSEVDRKFFVTNLLSNEDLEAPMDLTDIINFDPGITTEEFANNLPDELQLPFDEDDFSYLNTVKQHNLVNEWSDSSDSGVSGLLCSEQASDGVKSEPLSPVSVHSDGADSAISQLNEPCHKIFLANEASHDLPSATSQNIIDITQTPSPPSYIYTLKSSEDIKPALSPLAVALSPTTALSPAKEDPVKLQSILNSKIKIQPKPGTVQPSHSQTVSPSSSVLSTSSSCTVPSGTSSQQKSLVLTAEEFARLTNQGVLRFDSPKPEPVAPTTIIPNVSKTIPTSCISQRSPVPTVPLYQQHKLNIDDSDVKIMKRQQRMIKNRESASLSRKRKKEYLSELEVRLHQFTSENERLKEENHSLKRKLDELFSENETLKKKSTFTPGKKIALFAMVFMLSLNLAPWSSILSSETSGIRDHQLPNPRVHTGRQLMSVQEEPDYGWENTEYFQKLQKLILQYGGGADRWDNGTDLLWNMCPTYFNKTESIRLAEQLAGWMSRHQEQKKVVEKKKERRQKEKQLRPLSSLRRAMRGDIINNHDSHDTKYYSRSKEKDTQYQMQLFSGADTGRDFLKSIHRRNDTFYVLSFDTDYWLVPAVAHNKTMRPRMSLMMPALALNESMSPPPGRVGMMQIDCEVMNTQLIHVQKSAIPRRERENNTQSNFDKDSFYP